ncbi:alpha/beta hydrolase [Niallia oryzisoli]|uniref:Alpha/beta hydrolase n=1 Tax=Niallia oryzisoli TaxID=1737571 RepID=A0ABZ2CIW5_9BACI
MKERFQIIKGAESFYFKGSEIGILISHGFMGTPQSVRFLGESLARYGYTVLGVRLKGHGTHYRDLEKCTHEDWFESLERGYKELKQRCTSVFVIGQSMGGTLTLKLAHKYREIKGIMLINPALNVPAYEHLKEATKPKFIIEEKPDMNVKNVYEITYDLAPIKAIHELQKIMEMTPALLPSIQCPVLGIQSAMDHVVPPENTDFIIENIGSDVKEKLVLTNSYHVATMDYDKEKIVKYCHSFVQQQVGDKSVYQ